MSKVKLLVVGDRPPERAALVELLRNRGHETLDISGGDLPGMIGRERVSGVLLDAHPPDCSALHQLAEIRARFSANELAVIVLTDHINRAEHVRFFELGANDCVSRPLELSGFFARMEAHLRHQRSFQARNEFLVTASHELKSPLTSVLAAVRVLQTLCPSGGTVSEEAVDFLDEISANAARMRKTIGDLLDLEVLREGGVRLEKQPFDLNAVLTRAVSDLQDEARGSHITLSLELSRTVRVLGDVVRTMQVCGSLLACAVHCTPPAGTVVVRTRRCRESVRCEIEDQGNPIAEGERLQVHALRLGNGSRGRPPETCMGLAVCQQIVLLHGGAMGAYNNPQGGATFWFSLPRARELSVR